MLKSSPRSTTEGTRMKPSSTRSVTYHLIPRVRSPLSTAKTTNSSSMSHSRRERMRTAALPSPSRRRSAPELSVRVLLLASRSRKARPSHLSFEMISTITSLSISPPRFWMLSSTILRLSGTTSSRSPSTRADGERLCREA